MTKEDLLLLIDSDQLGIVIDASIICFLSLLIYLFRRFTAKSAVLRYIYGIIFIVTAAVLLYNIMLQQIPAMIQYFNLSPLVLFFQIALIIISVIIMLKYYAYLNKYEKFHPLLLERIQSINWKSSKYILFFTPVVILLLIRLRFNDGVALDIGFSAIVSSILFSPVIEELAFRVYLPKISKEGLMNGYDVIIYSLVFQALHYSSSSFMPFFMSLYLYFSYGKEKRVLLSVLLHSAYNAVVLLWPIV